MENGDRLTYLLLGLFLSILVAIILFLVVVLFGIAGRLCWLESPVLFKILGLFIWSIGSIIFALVLVQAVIGFRNFNKHLGELE